MTPATSLIIIKTRELLAATSDNVLAKMYTSALDVGIESSHKDSHTRAQLSALREHVGNMVTEEVAKEFRNSVDAIIEMGDDRIIAEHCKYVTQGILACVNEVQ